MGRPPTTRNDIDRRADARGDDGPIRLIAAVALFGSLVVAFGLIDLVSAIAPDPEFEPLRMLEAGWGILFAIVLPLALAAQIRRGGGPIAAAQQVGVVTVAVALATFLTLKAAELPLVLLLTLLTAADIAMHPARSRMFARDKAPNRFLAALAALASVPAGIYALDMAANRRAGVASDNTLGFDHWTVQGALPICLVLLVALSALETDGWRLPALSAAAGAVTLGALAISSGDVAANFGTGWAIAAIAWAALIALVVVMQR